MPDDRQSVELSELSAFAAACKFAGKGPLCVALHVTRVARDQGLPIDLKSLVVARGGQVAGLGRTSVQRILNEHGISRVLAEEGARTSRGSINNAERYAEFLNSHPSIDLQRAEEWWIGRVRAFFDSKPFRLNYDPSKSVRAIVRGVLAQAEARQKENPGATFAGTVLQHLVGAKLSLVMPDANVQTFGASVADVVSGRYGDFVVGTVAIHCTTAPGDALLRKCAENLAHGLQPIIVSLEKGVGAAEMFADQLSISDRVDIIDAEQFLAINIHEWSGFTNTKIRQTASDLIKRYNEIVDACETDRSLRIEM